MRSWAVVNRLPQQAQLTLLSIFSSHHREAGSIEETSHIRDLLSGGP